MKVEAAAINPIDWKVMRGDLRVVSGRGFPRFIGADFAGTIVAVGYGATGFNNGDAVFGSVNPLPGKRGSVAEFLVVGVSEIALKPPTIGLADAATLPIAGISALDCLNRLGEARRGQRVLVIGAAGGVGAFIVQLAKLSGLHVTGVCRECNRDWVRGFGADAVIASLRSTGSVVDR